MNGQLLAKHRRSLYFDVRKILLTQPENMRIVMVF